MPPPTLPKNPLEGEQCWVEWGRKKERKGKNNFSKIRPKTLISTEIFPHKKCIFLGEGAQVVFEIQRGISPSKISKKEDTVCPYVRANMGC